MAVVCQNVNCIYRNGSGFCTKDYVFLNAAGQCREWWNKNCVPRDRNVPIRQNNPASDKNG